MADATTHELPRRIAAIYSATRSMVTLAAEKAARPGRNGLLGVREHGRIAARKGGSSIA
ncbi:MAG: hypothetical protein WKG00_35800 [Polyangiaceae bacterium]